jgi:hypothetical protein
MTGQTGGTTSAIPTIPTQNLQPATKPRSWFCSPPSCSRLESLATVDVFSKILSYLRNLPFYSPVSKTISEVISDTANFRREQISQLPSSGRRSAFLQQVPQYNPPEGLDCLSQQDSYRLRQEGRRLTDKEFYPKLMEHILWFKLLKCKFNMFKETGVYCKHALNDRTLERHRFVSQISYRDQNYDPPIPAIAHPREILAIDGEMQEIEDLTLQKTWTIVMPVIVRQQPETRMPKSLQEIRAWMQQYRSRGYVPPHYWNQYCYADPSWKYFTTDFDGITSPKLTPNRFHGKCSLMQWTFRWLQADSLTQPEGLPAGRNLLSELQEENLRLEDFLFHGRDMFDVLREERGLFELKDAWITSMGFAHFDDCESQERLNKNCLDRLEEMGLAVPDRWRYAIRAETDETEIPDLDETGWNDWGSQQREYSECAKTLLGLLIMLGDRAQIENGKITGLDLEGLSRSAKDLVTLVVQDYTAALLLPEKPW